MRSRRTIGWFVGSGVALLCLSVPKNAAAQGPPRVPPWRLEYVVPRDTKHCPDEKYVHVAVGDELGYDPFDATAPRVVRVTVQPTPERIEAVIEARDENGKTQSHKTWAPTWRCDQLVDRAALFLVEIVSPIKAWQVASPAPPPQVWALGPRRIVQLDVLAPPVPTAPPAAVGLPTAAPKDVAPTRGWKPDMALSVAFGPTFLTTPGGVAPSLAAGTVLRWKWVAFRPEGSFDFSVGDSGRESWSWAVTPLVCGRLPLRTTPYSGNLCLGVHWADFYFRRDEALEPYTERARRGGLVRLGAEWQLSSRVFVFAAGDGVFADDIKWRQWNGKLWVTPGVTAALRVGLTWVFFQPR